jgi:hypothetical protein
MHATLHLLTHTDFPAPTRRAIETLQLNLGYRCNQSCLHCHVNAGPKRTEEMTPETIDAVLDFIAASPGITTIDLTGGAPELNPQFRRLVVAARARGEDARRVDPDRETKSVSAETTFEGDIADREALEAVLWRLCEKLSARLREKALAAAGVTLKLKTASFATRTRAARLPQPTRLPDVLFDAARPLLAREADGTAFRLIGIGAQPLAAAEQADRGDLADPEAPRRAARWAAVESLRAKFGEGAVVRGRGLPRGPRR